MADETETETDEAGFKIMGRWLIQLGTLMGLATQLNGLMALLAH